MTLNAEYINTTSQYVFMISLLPLLSNIAMYLVKTLLILLITISVLADPDPTETSTSTTAYSTTAYSTTAYSTTAYSNRIQPVVNYVLQYTDSWKIPQIDLTSAKDQLSNAVESSKNQLQQISNSIHQYTDNWEIPQVDLASAKNQLANAVETSKNHLQHIRSSLLQYTDNWEIPQVDLASIKHQLIDAANAYEKQLRRIRSSLLQYTDNWEVPQVDLASTKNQIANAVETSKNQLQHIRSSLLQYTDNWEAPQANLASTKHQLINAANAYKKQLQRIRSSLLQYTDNWKVPPVDLSSAKHRFIDTVKTSKNQLHPIRSYIWQATYYMGSLLPSKKTFSFDLQTTFSPKHLRTQVWNVYEANVDKLDPVIAKTTSAAANMLELFSQLLPTKSENDTIIYDSSDESSGVLGYICKVLDHAGHNIKECRPHIVKPNITYKTMTVSTTSPRVEGVSKNEIRQWNETRHDNVHENCTTTLKTDFVPLMLSIDKNEDGTTHLRYYTKNELAHNCLNDNSSKANSDQLFAEKLAGKRNFPVFGLLFNTPLFFYFSTVWQIIWFLVPLDAFLKTMTIVLRKNRVRESYLKIAIGVACYIACYCGIRHYLIPWFLPFNVDHYFMTFINTCMDSINAWMAFIDTYLID
ncbi:hypothetical protein MBANPS3_011379 [Mucor bainieri]